MLGSPTGMDGIRTKPMGKLKYFKINKVIQAWESNTTEPVVNKIRLFLFFKSRILGAWQRVVLVPIIHTI